MRSGESAETLRRFRLRDDFMRWLYQRHLGGIDRPPFSHFVLERHGEPNQPYDEAEVHATTKWLKDMGFIKGEAAMQTRGGVLRPGLTTLGMNRVERGQSVNEQEIATVNINATNSNVVYQSSHVTQSLVVTEEGASDVQAAINGIMALLDSSDEFNGEQGVELRDAVDVLQGEVTQGHANPEKLKRWLAKAVTALAPVGAVADVAAVVGLIQTAIGSLG